MASAVEMRVRRAAERRGLTLSKSKVKDRGLAAFGKWCLKDASGDVLERVRNGEPVWIAGEGWQHRCAWLALDDIERLLSEAFSVRPVKAMALDGERPVKVVADVREPVDVSDLGAETLLAALDALDRDEIASALGDDCKRLARWTVMAADDSAGVAATIGRALAEDHGEDVLSAFAVDDLEAALEGRTGSKVGRLAETAGGIAGDLLRALDGWNVDRDRAVGDLVAWASDAVNGGRVVRDLSELAR